METDLRDDIRRWLAEDLGRGDVTTLATVSQNATVSATVIAKSPLVLAGIDVARAVFEQRTPAPLVSTNHKDGDAIDIGVSVAGISGNARAILTAERLALNLLQHLSGIATLTRRFVEAVDGTGAAILDTRKTTPGLRVLEKAAVRAGGGRNHRFGLDDGILVKDNHIAAAGGVLPAIRRARDYRHHLLKIEVEVSTLEQLEEALKGGAEAILLDNMDLLTMKKAVEINAGRVPLEASGNVTLETVKAIAETGVDYISVGALTHSAPAADLSLKIK